MLLISNEQGLVETKLSINTDLCHDANRLDIDVNQIDQHGEIGRFYKPVDSGF